MNEPLEIDDPVAFTKCPCCHAEIEVRERWSWVNDDNCWYVVVPDGTPSAVISREEFQQWQAEQKKKL